MYTTDDRKPITTLKNVVSSGHCPLIKTRTDKTLSDAIQHWGRKANTVKVQEEKVCPVNKFNVHKCAHNPTRRRKTADKFLQIGKRGFVDFGPSLSEIMKASEWGKMTKAVQGREERDEQWQSATTKRNLDQLDAFVCLSGGMLDIYNAQVEAFTIQSWPNYHWAWDCLPLAPLNRDHNYH